MEDLLKRWQFTLKVFATVTAALFALWQYYDHINDARVEHTLKFYKRYSSAPLFTARLDTAKNLEKLWSQVEKLRTGHSPTELAAERRQWQAFVVTNIKADAHLAGEIDALYEFFDALQVCAENNICDSATAHELLDDEARQFVENYCPYMAYIQHTRKTNSFGAKASKFAHNPCDVSIYS